MNAEPGVAQRSSRPDLLSALPASKRRDVEEIYRTLHAAGRQCYLVGGAVRDLVMGRAAGDLDFTTDARPDQVIALFRRTAPTGLHHGTVTVLLGDAAYEVTTFRRETVYSDARRPDRVEYADSLEEDLSRRDFTVNALAFDPGAGLLIDCYGGLRDIEQRLLRTIGRPEDRFYEDGLRPIRACRFVATLGFRLDAATERAMRQSDVQRRTAMIAVERFSDELWKGMHSPRPGAMIEALESTGLLYIFLTEEFGRFERTAAASLERINASQCQASLRMAMWWDELGLGGEQRLERLGRALKFSGRHVKEIVWLHKYFAFQKELTRAGAFVDEVASMESVRPELRVQLRRFLSGVKEAFREEAIGFLELAAPYPLHAAPARVLIDSLRTESLSIRDLAVNGEDLMKLGLSGPQIGGALKRLLEHVLRDQGLNQKERLLQLARGV